ncbi:CMP-N-acetylneuraminate-beta-galactosamide-alpha-2,3-sialyltransferase 4 [Willisornis vidua]|uniref:CMP-N-acetylneuraminate-beta-galactosamide-alpha-2,3-sialyltransferase 4 n=1 Tax=Willisornis vidua TaxID=1566151 RepID=A0ABQ9DDV0_9PASS|nr:CMP-N-acetylneuraminate-beta-galactosamide-alpha-2,3-sialyltransferase 4 [Willisornis vidua]
MDWHGMAVAVLPGRGREDGPVDPVELPPAPPGPRGRTVTSHDESSGPCLIPSLLIKMINKSQDALLRLVSITHYSLPESIQRALSGSLKCRRCAVVGNGHRLRNSSMGETINTYDVVIRLNNAPVHGYEQDVGSKTTMRLFYLESAHFDPRTENNPDTLLVLVPFKPMDFQWMEAILNDKKRVRKGFWKQPPLIWDANPEQVRILNPYYMLWLSAPVPQKPTTGLLAITLALHFCDLVHIAGFGYPDSGNKKQTIYYYEQVTLKSMAASEHNVSHEAVAIKRMLELGLVKNLTYF